MRPDQMERMRDLSEKLADKFIDEADPETWPGAGAMLADMTKQERGDAYWCKKNAAATLALLCRVEQLQASQRTVQPPGDDEPGIESEIERAEKQAAKMLESVLSKAGKVTADGARGKKR